MFVPTSHFGCCFGISFGCFLYIHFGCCFDIFLCAFGNDHANDGFGLLGLFLTSLHSPYHSVTFKFDLFGKRRFKSLASKKHRMESVCRSRKIGFRLFALPFPPLLHSAVSVSPPLLISYIDKQELCADGLPFPADRFRSGLRHRFCLFRLDLFRCLYYHYSILLGFVNTFFENFFNFFVKHLQKKK